MRRALFTIVAGAALLAPAPAAPQSLAARIAALPADATVRFEFTPKPGVCGDGESIMIDEGRGGGMTIIQHADGASYRTSSGRYDDGRLRDCRAGNVVVQLTRVNGRITSAHATVGAPAPPPGTDLGVVDPQAAADFLLSDDIVQLRDRVAERMMFSATLAPVETWPALLRLARSTRLSSGIRSSAIHWLGNAAGQRVTEGLVSIVGDDSDEIEVRKSAVFALSRRPGDEAVTELMRIARTNREPEIRRNAMFWLARKNDPRVVDFFEQILRG